MSATASRPTRAKTSGLRANALAGVIMILIEYGLGITVNLYSTLPAADRGTALLGGVGAAVGNGPLPVALHALLGTILLLTGIAAVVRASLIGARPLIALSGGALLATLVAWLSGSSFIGHQRNGASLAMALAAAVAILCYVLLIFRLGAGRPTASSDRDLA